VITYSFIIRNFEEKDRNRGIGKELIETVIAEAGKLGV